MTLKPIPRDHIITILVTLFSRFPLVSAGSGGEGGWEEFTDNFATDLAPLIALFGERLTKQFLSESTSLLDNLIFALSPLGILTAVVSVIRVCGNSSLRAFVGRAQEAPGEAENELLSCVSETTAELFNDGGISRVFGRPRILEVVVWEEVEAEPEPETVTVSESDSGSVSCGKDVSYRIGTLRDALNQGAWFERDDALLQEKGPLPELDIPNLSLNKGIERRAPGWFYSAAFLGVVLQAGTLVYSALTVFLYPDRFKKNDKRVDSYAFPLYVYGTISLGVGMFLCAFMIERSSREYYLYPARPSKIYWLQPGRQKIGEQDFGAFLAVNEGPDSQTTKNLSYIKSIQGPASKGKGLLLVFTISVTMIGFVLQFVGLRGLHPSVILADLGSKLVMTVVRTCLRAKRIGSNGNRFGQEDRDLSCHKQQELDCFAFYLEGVTSFRLVSSIPHESARFRSGSCSTGDSSSTSSSPFLTQSPGLGTRLVKTRARLAQLTSSASRHPSMDWHDLLIRTVARHLAVTIESTMELVSRWKAFPSNVCSFELSFACQTDNHKSISRALGTYPVILRRSDDTFQWRVDSSELEAVLGLWTLSLLKWDPKWLQQSLTRAVGLTKSEAKAEKTDLYFHKWIFRQREASMVSSKMISFSEQAFGFHSDEYLGSQEILVVKTDNRLEVMAAQDIYIKFLTSILLDMASLGGDVNVLPMSHNSFIARSTHLEELVNCFEYGSLGSREDALLCIVPVLKYRNLLPELAADSTNVRLRIKNLVSNSNWDDAFSMLLWLCERCEGDEFERSVYELGLLCQRAMLQRDGSLCEKGFKVVCSLLQTHVRAGFLKSLRCPRPLHWMNSLDQQEWWSDFAKQLRWVAWHITSGRRDGDAMRLHLESPGFSTDLASQGDRDPADQVRASTAQHTFLGWVASEVDFGPHGWTFSHEDEARLEVCLGWMIENAQNALLHWLLARLAEKGQECPHLAMKAYEFAAKHESDSAIRILGRHGADINTLGCDFTALIELVLSGDSEACVKILANGADVNLPGRRGNIFPLTIAADQGNEEMSLLLLKHGANLENRDDMGYTALHKACRENRLNTVTLLLDRGANIETVANDGRTPIITAVADSYLDLTQLLLERGSRIDTQDNNGNTALIRAVCERTESATAILRLLLNRGADTDLRDHLGRTALDRAREMHHQEAIEILSAATRAKHI